MSSKKLKRGVTCLGTTTIETDEGDRQVRIFFGNGLITTDGRLCYERLDRRAYEKSLMDFLNSEDGIDYEIPDEAEKRDAEEYIAEKLAGRKIAEEKQRKSPEYLDERTAAKAAGYHKGKGDAGAADDAGEAGTGTERRLRRRSVILSVTVLVLSLTCLFQMLLNLFLLTGG